MPKEFLYRGFNIQQLREMSMDEFIKLLPSRQRRSLQRGLTPAQRRLLEEIKEFRHGSRKESDVLKTHARDMVILPEMVGLRILVHNGKEFTQVDVTPEMVGHYLGEFAITNKKVVHGTPGIGASRSSMYVPLK
ncbi:30S ribosomal protein S19 [Candidatus Bathyarchaeota archaeon]|nr:30S ribosomal protein S19 [Candidatus Bathyarchaeota archaeon]